MQHSERTQRGPARRTIALALIEPTATLAVAWYIASGTTLDLRHLAGLILAMAATIVLAGRAGSLIIERDQARLKVELAARQRARNTGTWENEDGQTLIVRWDPQYGRWIVGGYLGGAWSAQWMPETIWHDVDSLARTIADLEDGGEMVPWSDEGTEAVRFRLDAVMESDGYPQDDTYVLPQDAEEARMRVDAMVTVPLAREGVYGAAETQVLRVPGYTGS